MLHSPVEYDSYLLEMISHLSEGKKYQSTAWNVANVSRDTTHYCQHAVYATVSSQAIRYAHTIPAITGKCRTKKDVDHIYRSHLKLSSEFALVVNEVLSSFKSKQDTSPWGKGQQFAFRKYSSEARVQTTKVLLVEYIANNIEWYYL